MRKAKMLTATALVLIAASLCVGDDIINIPAVPVQQRSWREILPERIRQYGEGNWIVIADSAYPAETNIGIETIVTGAEQIDVLKAVMAELQGVKHVKAIPFTETELKFIAEQDAPGITNFRQQIAGILGDHSAVGEKMRLELMNHLDDVAPKFQVLVLKTNQTLPYSAVFLQLDTKYWTPEAEKRMRDAMR